MIFGCLTGCFTRGRRYSGDATWSYEPVPRAIPVRSSEYSPIKTDNQVSSSRPVMEIPRNDRTEIRSPDARQGEFSHFVPLLCSTKIPGVSLLFRSSSLMGIDGSFHEMMLHLNDRRKSLSDVNDEETTSGNALLQRRQIVKQELPYLFDLPPSVSPSATPRRVKKVTMEGMSTTSSRQPGDLCAADYTMSSVAAIGKPSPVKEPSQSEPHTNVPIAELAPGHDAQVPLNTMDGPVTMAVVVSIATVTEKQEEMGVVVADLLREVIDRVVETLEIEEDFNNFPVNCVERREKAKNRAEEDNQAAPSEIKTQILVAADVHHDEDNEDLVVLRMKARPPTYSCEPANPCIQTAEACDRGMLDVHPPITIHPLTPPLSHNLIISELEEECVAPPAHAAFPAVLAPLNHDVRCPRSPNPVYSMVLPTMDSEDYQNHANANDGRLNLSILPEDFAPSSAAFSDITLDSTPSPSLLVDAPARSAVRRRGVLGLRRLTGEIAMNGLTVSFTKK